MSESRKWSESLVQTQPLTKALARGAAALVLTLAGTACDSSDAPPPPIPLEERTPKVILIGIDGVRPDVLAEVPTPNLDALGATGTFTARTQTTTPSVSGPSWSSMLTGVWPEKHGVTDNEFGGRNYEDWPDFLTRIEPASNDSEVVQSEIFGPVLTFQTFADEAEAVSLANSTAYGLSSIVYTGSRDRAERLGREIRAGLTWVNTFLVRDLTAPFGGCGISGIGREGGEHALDFHADLKTVMILDGTTS